MYKTSVRPVMTYTTEVRDENVITKMKIRATERLLEQSQDIHCGRDKDIPHAILSAQIVLPY